MRGRASSLFLSGQFKTPEFSKLIEELDTKYPNFAPVRFLKHEIHTALAREPRMLQQHAKTVSQVLCQTFHLGS